MTEPMQARRGVRYPVAIRLLHWVRALLILGLIATGWLMTGRAEDDAMAATLYPNHKQFGVFVWLVALVHLTLRWHYRAILPHAPQSLKGWEKWLSHGIHRLIIALTFLTPLLGYSMSTSLPQGDGVPFFFLPHLPGIPAEKRGGVFGVSGLAQVQRLPPPELHRSAHRRNREAQAGGQ